MTPVLLAACGGFLLAVLWMDLMFDVQVLPSLWEGIPLTLFEGMAAGKTIVSTNVDGLGEVLEDGRNALVVPPRDPQALARAVIRVLDDAALAARLAARAKAESARYEIDATVRRIEEIYEEVLGR